MTRDEIIEMARQVGLEQDGEMWFSNTYKTDMDVHINHLEAFAKMVAAKEREACAKVCEHLNSTEDYYGERIELFCAEAIRARGEKA